MKLERLIPMLPVKAISVSIEFYRKLGFSVERKSDEWGWAMLQSGDCRIMIDQSINHGPDAARQSVIYLYPDDVAAYRERVRKNGINVPELSVTFYGMMEFRIDDPDGNRLWIGQSKSTKS